MWDSPILKDFLSLLRFAPPLPSVEVSPTTVQVCTRSGSDTIIVTTRHKHATVLKQHLATNELPTTKLKSTSLGYLSSQVLILINLSIHVDLYDVGRWKLLHSRLLDLLASAAALVGCYNSHPLRFATSSSPSLLIMCPKISPMFCWCGIRLYSTHRCGIRLDSWTLSHS